jgi:hypothetical protein
MRLFAKLSTGAGEFGGWSSKLRGFNVFMLSLIWKEQGLTGFHFISRGKIV